MVLLIEFSMFHRQYKWEVVTTTLPLKKRAIKKKYINWITKNYYEQDFVDWGQHISK